LQWTLRTLRLQFELIRQLGASYRSGCVASLFPADMRELFQELLDEPCTGRTVPYVDTIVAALARDGLDTVAIRDASHVVRNLSVAELFVAGDMGDRGPRVDHVISYLEEQPHVAITWGNHDASWMGACLGNEAAIATVLRISIRYRRLSQLEEGYGIICSPLERLARTAYADDPAVHFTVKGSGLRDDLLMARMQKAAAIMQFKLEGQAARRHPAWELERHNLLHRINPTAGTVEIDGEMYPLLDTHFPTVDWNDPYRLSVDEQQCMDRLRQSFVNSPRLWDHMSFLVNRGTMWQRRDDVLIFHACVPVDENGEFLCLEVDGVEESGRALFDAINSLVRREFRKGAAEAGDDSDWLWYLWFGERSPLFGKDKMATFELYFVGDKKTHVETKNPYFELIHDAGFCRRILREFGVSEDGLIVNGHVPVKIEKGEQPLKRGGNAVTIDGAFSEAFGDHGYTLVLAPDRISLAEHYHFESIEDAIIAGWDIVPKITTLRTYNPPRTVDHTEDGERTRLTITMLERLIRCYEDGALPEGSKRVG
nr:fructose-1,6-bisphosphatase [Armatimonadota bacterium]